MSLTLGKELNINISSLGLVGTSHKPRKWLEVALFEAGLSKWAEIKGRKVENSRVVEIKIPGFSEQELAGNLGMEKVPPAVIDGINGRYFEGLRDEGCPQCGMFKRGLCSGVDRGTDGSPVEREAEAQVPTDEITSFLTLERYLVLKCLCHPIKAGGSNI